jgi:hypothetical protein
VETSWEESGDDEERDTGSITASWPHHSMFWASGEAIGAGESREITPWEAGIVCGGMGWFNDSRRSCCRAADPCESGSMVWI